MRGSRGRLIKPSTAAGPWRPQSQGCPAQGAWYCEPPPLPSRCAPPRAVSHAQRPAAAGVACQRRVPGARPALSTGPPPCATSGKTPRAGARGPEVSAVRQAILLLDGAPRPRPRAYRRLPAARPWRPQQAIGFAPSANVRGPNPRTHPFFANSPLGIVAPASRTTRAAAALTS